MTTYSDLEIGLHWREQGSYSVELRFSQPGNITDVRLTSDGPAQVRFDRQRLGAEHADPATYGQLLSEMLFADPAIKEAFRTARKTSQSIDAPLRVRLFIGPSSPELHGIYWETLRDPDDNSLLLTSENLLFSRYLSSLDWRPIPLRRRSELRALVVIASPTDIAKYQPGGRPLAALDVAGELDRARASLGDIPITALASGGSATVDNLSTQLREGYDILYLVSHGALMDGEPWLWLEDEGGAVARVNGAGLVVRLREMRERPRLVVLASCQSAGKGDDARSEDQGALAALGPGLAEAGIPAVLAMQGNVHVETVSRFMPVFFQELQRDGQIDRAMAVARGAVRDRFDWWMPVLFMRLKNGCIWYEHGFSASKSGYDRWDGLVEDIRNHQCTPILGPGLVESLLGSSRAIARRWADHFDFPMAPHNQEDLPQVAQYLAYRQNKSFPRTKFGEYLKEEIRRRYADQLPLELHDGPLDKMLSMLGEQRRARVPTDVHTILAALPFPIYITTNRDNLLYDALQAANKQPEVVLCRWNDWVEWPHSVFEKERGYRPEEQRPLIYHLFGNLQHPTSLVLTEDDYYDYLIGVTKNQSSKVKSIPLLISKALTSTGLLFLGFQIDDWDFRILFRSILGQEGGERRNDYTNVAVQIDPVEGRILEPQGARRYLERYFQKTSSFSIYWGSVENFVQELLKRCKEKTS